MLVGCLLHDDPMDPTGTTETETEDDLEEELRQRMIWKKN